jgi:hypothetical protein
MAVQKSKWPFKKAKNHPHAGICAVPMMSYQIHHSQLNRIQEKYIDDTMSVQRGTIVAAK